MPASRSLSILRLAGKASIRQRPVNSALGNAKPALAETFICAYNLLVHITYDQAKNQRNIAERDLPFDEAAAFDFETALIHVDERHNYSETRYVALGFLHGRLHVLCFAEEPDGIRVISFRKANSREVSRYAKVQAAD